MTEHTEEKGKQTFRAHVGSPLNKGEAVLELTYGTTVESMLRALANLWGVDFAPERGFGWLAPSAYLAGWCVLCRGVDGRYEPLGIEDTIPNSPPTHEPQEGHSRGYHLWPEHTMDRLRLMRGSPWDTDADDSLSSSDPSPPESVFLRHLASRLRAQGFRGALPPGILDVRHHLWGAPGYEVGALSSAPEPKDEVDVRLVVVIAVSGA